MLEIISSSSLEYINATAFPKKMSLFSNIINNYNYLRQDFTGITFNSLIIFNLLINILIPVIIIIIFYLIGLKIKLLFFKKYNGIVDFFIKIALGYIFITSGFLILGMLGMFYQSILYSYYAFLIIVALFPLNTLKKRLNIFLEIFNEYHEQFLKYKLVNIAILAFVLISFLRLIPPETGVDALWYHTDYPQAYLNSHSMMNIDPIGKYYPAVTPTLSDMIYVFTESVQAKDSSRFIHFGFYLLVLFEFLIIFKKRFPFIPYAVLLFVTSPIIIRVSSSAYAEFQWVFCWLPAVFLITSKNKHNIKDLVLPAILLGGALATKLWMLPFFGVFFLYLLAVNISENKIKLFKLLTVFTLLSFSIPFLWYLRSFLITGNPLFPTFWNYPDGTANSPFNFSFDLYGLKTRLLSAANVSPLSIFGIIFLLPFLRKVKNWNPGKYPFATFVIILTAVQLIINYSFHRFVIPFYSIFAIVLALGIERFVLVHKFFKFSFYAFFSLLFLYYFLNTLFILPYGLGFANENRYLTRILSRNNSSYYDYNYQFSKLISNDDLVATYGLWGFYYANFNFVYTEDIFRKGERSLGTLNKRGANKLLLLGGDITWLCKTERLTDCSKNKYKLLTSYKFPTAASSQYLYELNKYAK